MRKRRIIFIIILTIVFIWLLIGAIIFPPAIPVVIAIYFLILFFTGKKEEVKSRIKIVGEKTRDVIDIGSTALEEAGKTAANISVNATRIIAKTVEQGYNAMGREEGARKALEALGKFTEAGLKIGVEATIVGGKVIAEVSKYTMQRIEQEKGKSLTAPEKKLLNEYVEFVVLDDD
ncbi:MAG: hypothetical protein FWH35_00765 [Treponema sp.]|nr:hypothetical protein [Treponema sp.]